MGSLQTPELFSEGLIHYLFLKSHHCKNRKGLEFVVQFDIGNAGKHASRPQMWSGGLRLTEAAISPACLRAGLFSWIAADPKL